VGADNLDAKAVEAFRDPATYAQAIAKADDIMKEIPQSLRMSTWWLLPVSLRSRVAAIARA